MDQRWLAIAHSRGTRGKLRDAAALRRNVYRVLLTRGRDVTVIFVPMDSRLDDTHSHLIDVGVRKLA
ncbi:MAG: DUF2075 domain-containing protein [Betaproteobacteria bacterium]|nr:DUF2075 domain-containing protein [Betaproteobacteria bacterium]